MAFICLAMDRPDEARTFSQASLRLQASVGRKRELVSSLECLAEVSRLEGRWEQAVRLCGAWGALLGADVRPRSADLSPAEGLPESLAGILADARRNGGTSANHWTPARPSSSRASPVASPPRPQLGAWYDARGGDGQ